MSREYLAILYPPAVWPARRKALRVLPRLMMAGAVGGLAALLLGPLAYCLVFPVALSAFPEN